MYSVHATQSPSVLYMYLKTTQLNRVHRVGYNWWTRKLLFLQRKIFSLYFFLSAHIYFAFNFAQQFLHQIIDFALHHIGIFRIAGEKNNMIRHRKCNLLSDTNEIVATWARRAYAATHKTNKRNSNNHRQTNGKYLKFKINNFFVCAVCVCVRVRNCADAQKTAQTIIINTAWVENLLAFIQMKYIFSGSNARNLTQHSQRIFAGTHACTCTVYTDEMCK